MAETRIAKLLAGRAAVEHHAPWPRHEVDAETWIAVAEALGQGGGDLLGLWGDDGAVHLALRAPDMPEPCILTLAVDHLGTYPAVGRYHPPAIRLERAIFDLYGHVAAGAPDHRPWVDHGAWGVRTPLGAREDAALRDPAAYDFLPVHGGGLHQVAVGPVHASIIEPGHFRFTANGETVVRLEQRFGYVHKGIEALFAGADIARAEKLAARISGDATVAYSFAFARAVEAALGLEPPPRAVMLRGLMAELERLANHLGDIGAICNDAAFVLIPAYGGILRERMLAACDIAFGHRLMMDRVVCGGVAVDIAADGAAAIRAALDEVEVRMVDVTRVYDDTPSLQDRTCGTGIVDPALARQWAPGGHVGRACGRDFDTRRDLAYPPYADATFAVPVFTTGDVDARVWVRIREVDESIKLVRNWLAALPPGDLRVNLPGAGRSCEGVAMVESFRGDVLVWVRLGADGRIERCHARDPSCFQWPLLEAAIENNIVADFPICNKSFNCSYSGHDL